jgi:hypothetical protein
MLTPRTKNKLQEIQNTLHRIQTFRMMGKTTSDLEKEVSALKVAVDTMIDALRTEPDEK